MMYQIRIIPFLLLLIPILLFIPAGVSAQGTIDWPEISVSQLVSGLNRPVHVTHAGDGSGRLFIVEQVGRIRIFKNNSLLSTSFLNISTRVRCCGERGLLSVAFPPGFDQKQYFYVNYTDLSGDTVVARYHVTMDPDIADANSEEIIINIPQPFSNHNGGQIAFGPDGHLYIGMGDGGDADDPLNSGQNPQTLLGKMLRLDVESGVTPYAIPPDNPYVDNPSVLDEIWALGLRNPWRFAFDSLTGDLYIADVGQNSLEEIDFQAASSSGGENYGWRIMEGTECFNDPNCDQTGLTLPVAEYSHLLGCSVTGGTVYRGQSFPRMQGIYFYGDYCSGRIWGLKKECDAFSDTVLLDSILRIASFGEDEAGELYITDLFNGIIYKIMDNVSEAVSLIPVPSCHDYGDVITGNQSGPQTFALHNISTESLTIDTISLMGADALDFIRQDDQCSDSVLMTSDSCTIDVLFSPLSGGQKTATIDIPFHNAGTFSTSVSLQGTGQPDTDGDGVADNVDNCREEPNPDQRDTNSGEDDNSFLDGVQHYGNACDPDFDNDGIVSILDLAIWRQNVGDPVPPAPDDLDINGDGVIWLQDLAVWRALYGLPPGPGIGD